MILKSLISAFLILFSSLGFAAYDSLDQIKNCPSGRSAESVFKNLVNRPSKHNTERLSANPMDIADALYIYSELSKLAKKHHSFEAQSKIENLKSSYFIPLSKMKTATYLRTLFDFKEDFALKMMFLTQFFTHLPDALQITHGSTLDYVIFGNALLYLSVAPTLKWRNSLSHQIGQLKSKLKEQNLEDSKKYIKLFLELLESDLPQTALLAFNPEDTFNILLRIKSQLSQLKPLTEQYHYSSRTHLINEALSEIENAIETTSLDRFFSFRKHKSRILLVQKTLPLFEELSTGITETVKIDAITSSNFYDLIKNSFYYRNNLSNEGQSPIFAIDNAEGNPDLNVIATKIIKNDLAGVPNILEMYQNRGTLFISAKVLRSDEIKALKSYRHVVEFALRTNQGDRWSTEVEIFSKNEKIDSALQENPQLWSVDVIHKLRDKCYLALSPKPVIIYAGSGSAQPHEEMEQETNRSGISK